MNRRIAVVALAILAIGTFYLVLRPSHKLLLRSYFADAMGIRSGAAVRLAGVKVGTVKSVRIQTSIKDAPAELTMVLETGYDLRIPQDSAVMLQTAGILGETYAEIEIAGTSGPPVSTNAVLRGGPTNEVSLKQVIERLSAALKTCSEQRPQAGNEVPARNGATPKKSPAEPASGSDPD